MKIPYLRSILLYSLFLSIIAFGAGCVKTSTSTISVVLPIVNTDGVIINLTSTTATSGGFILSRGNGSLTANGVCYSSTNKVPTVTDSKTTDSISKAGTSFTTFLSNIKGLSPNTTYYLRAYATNSAGVGYGGVFTFSTGSAETNTGATVSTFAGTGTAGFLNGAASTALFNNPQGLSFDKQGNLFVSDSFNDLIREISPSANVTTYAGDQSIGFLNGPALSAEFYAPCGQATDAQGNLYVSDFGNNVIRKITPAGVVSTYAGTGVAGYRNGAVDSANLKSSTDSLAMFNNPQGVCVDGSGNVYVADRGNNVIRVIMPTGRTKTLAGNKVKGFIDATGAVAFFNNPTGVAVDASGTVYVTDQGNSSLRKVSSAGVVTTIVGNPYQTGLFNFPSAITMDSKGNFFIADEGGRIYEYTKNNVLYILAGVLNSPGFTNGAGSVAQFSGIQGIAVDANDNIFVGDQNNNVIREITLSVGSPVAVTRKKGVTLK